MWPSCPYKPLTLMCQTFGHPKFQIKILIFRKLKNDKDECNNTFWKIAAFRMDPWRLLYLRLRDFSSSQLIVLRDGEIPYVRWVQIGSRPFGVEFGKTVCGDFKRGLQNSKDFCLRINILKGNFWIFIGRCQKVQNHPTS